MPLSPIDSRNDRMQAKIRDAQMRKIPKILVIGRKEAEGGLVSLRDREDGDLGQIKLDALIAQFQTANAVGRPKRLEKRRA
jgi:threonyl-tRNA synthetase